MVGRKLTERLVRDATLAGEPITHAALVDVVEPDRPDAPFAVDTARAGSRRARRGRGAGRRPARRHLPPGGRALGRGGGRLRQGISRQRRRDATPSRSDPRARRLLPARRVRVVDRRVRRAVSRDHRRRLHHRPANELRNARRRSASSFSPTTPGAAFSTASGSGFPRSACAPASPTWRRRDSSRTSSASHSTAARPCSPCPTTSVTGTPRLGPQSTFCSTPRRSTPTRSAHDAV